jgi:thymidylate synthase (FAD)
VSVNLVIRDAIKLRSDMSAKLVQHAGSDESFVAAARVSTIGPQSEAYLATPAEESAGLINYLMKGRHGSPFEHSSMTFKVEAPIAVFREFHRHRIGWSYNEWSGRYSTLTPEFWVPDANRNLRQIGKAGAYEFVEAPELRPMVLREMREAYEAAWDAYDNMLDRGVAKEVARYVMPVATYTSMYATCNARSAMAFLSLRTTADGTFFPSFPMREIEQVGEQIEEQFASLFPITYDAFNKNGRVAP